MAYHEQGAAIVADGVREGMIRISGGTFRMGSDRHYPKKPRCIASPSTTS
jgi:formylglycine-generating enzyme required for sulfatase activity